MLRIDPIIQFQHGKQNPDKVLENIDIFDIYAQ